MNVSEGYAKGFSDGWDKCREFICKEFNLNREEVIGLEYSDKIEEVKSDE